MMHEPTLGKGYSMDSAAGASGVESTPLHYNISQKPCMLKKHSRGGLMDLINSPIVFIVPLAVLVLGSLYIKKVSKKDQGK